MRRIGYQNAVLTAIAVLLALNLVDHRGAGLTDLPAAQAQQPESDQGGMTNRLEQNKQIIAELRNINSKLEKLDAKLSAGVNVKVTSMPAIQVNENGKKNKDKEEAAPAAKPAPSK